MKRPYFHFIYKILIFPLLSKYRISILQLVYNLREQGFGLKIYLLNLQICICVRLGTNLKRAKIWKTFLEGFE